MRQSIISFTWLAILILFHVVSGQRHGNMIKTVVQPKNQGVEFIHLSTKERNLRGHEEEEKQSGMKFGFDSLEGDEKKLENDSSGEMALDVGDSLYYGYTKPNFTLFFEYEGQLINLIPEYNEKYQGLVVEVPRAYQPSDNSDYKYTIIPTDSVDLRFVDAFNEIVPVVLKRISGEAIMVQVPLGYLHEPNGVVTPVFEELLPDNQTKETKA